MTAQPSHYDVLDAYQNHFVDQGDDSAAIIVHQEARALYASAIENVLEGQSPDAFLVIQFSSETEPWVLIAVGGSFYLSRLHEEEAEVRWLGALTGGRYVERFRYSTSGLVATLRFEHERIDDAVLLKLTPDPSPGVSLSHADRSRRTNIKKLRELFRAAANAAPAIPNQ